MSRPGEKQRGRRRRRRAPRLIRVGREDEKKNHRRHRRPRAQRCGPARTSALPSQPGRGPGGVAAIRGGPEIVNLTRGCPRSRPTGSPWGAPSAGLRAAACAARTPLSPPWRRRRGLHGSCRGRGQGPTHFYISKARPPAPPSASQERGGTGRCVRPAHNAQAPWASPGCAHRLEAGHSGEEVRLRRRPPGESRSERRPPGRGGAAWMQRGRAPPARPLRRRGGRDENRS